jgi:hypothetical protein
MYYLVVTANLEGKGGKIIARLMKILTSPKEGARCGGTCL